MAEHFIGYVEVETPKALLFQDHFWHAPEWMPKSQVSIQRTESVEVTITATAWICGQKDIRENEELKNAEDTESGK